MIMLHCQACGHEWVAGFRELNDWIVICPECESPRVDAEDCDEGAEERDD